MRNQVSFLTRACYVQDLGSLADPRLESGATRKRSVPLMHQNQFA